MLTRIDGYVIITPKSFDPVKSYTGFLFAHGMGQRGDGSGVNVEGWMKDEAQKLIDLVESSNLILIAPNLLANKNWTDDYFDAAYSYLLSHYKVAAKVFTDGVSLGGQAIWSWGAHHPDLVLGIHGTAPVYVSVDFCKIKCPVLVHHSKTDPTVGVAQGESAVNQIKACGGNASIIYFGSGHEIWRSNKDWGVYSVYEQPETKSFFGVSSQDPVPVPPAPSPTPSTKLKADASATKTDITGTKATLDGSRSTGNFTWSGWEMLSGPGKFWEVFPGYKKGGVSVQVENLLPGTYVARYTIGDAKGNYETDYVTLNVTAGKKIFKEIIVDGQKITLFEDSSWQVG